MIMLHDKEFIVSLTSWKKRIDIVHNAIESIMNQTVKPDKIVLNLSLDEFPSGNDELPENLTSLIENGLEIGWVKKNSRSFKKLIPTLDKYRDAIVMTIDDDIVYPNDFIEKKIPLYHDKPLSFDNGHLFMTGYCSFYEYRFFGDYLHKFDNELVWYSNEDDMAYGILMMLNSTEIDYQIDKYHDTIIEVDDENSMSRNKKYNTFENYRWFYAYLKKRFGLTLAELIANNTKHIVKTYKDNTPMINLDTLMIYEYMKERYPLVSMIVLNKDRSDLMQNLLASVKEKCKYPSSCLRIYIADTGSSEQEKDKIKTIIGNLNLPYYICMAEYDYYNFAKINNDMVKKHIKSDTKLLLFCNNDIVLENDAISNMVDAYVSESKKHNVGTIGARLNYGDGTIQHLGIHLVTNGKVIAFEHIGSHKKIEDIKPEDKEHTHAVFANTFAFAMINKDIFEKFGLLDEVFKSCFEDVDLNFKLYKNGYVNILNPNAICTHYESLTRKNTVDNDDLMCMFQRVLKDEKIYNYFINKNKENKQK